MSLKDIPFLLKKTDHCDSSRILIPKPNESTLPRGVALHCLTDDALNLSTELVALLVDARNKYEWPSDKGTARSHKTIIELEEDVSAVDERSKHKAGCAGQRRGQAPAPAGEKAARPFEKQAVGKGSIRGLPERGL